jgi:DNA helicase IV
VTISGDQAQQIDPGACFTDWERALSVLEVEGSEPIHLRTSYRCPAPITRFAHQVLGPLAPDEMPRAAQQGPPVLRSCFPTEAHLAYQLVRALADLVEREPAASVAVIARTPQTAERFHGVLERSIPARLVRAGEFSFTPGIDVTDVAQVKGLEFDVVVVPDATPTSFPDDPDSRRKLHVACTRAISQLWVLSVGRPSPILPSQDNGSVASV